MEGVRFVYEEPFVPLFVATVLPPPSPFVRGVVDAGAFVRAATVGGDPPPRGGVPEAVARVRPPQRRCQSTTSGAALNIDE